MSRLKAAYPHLAELPPTLDDSVSGTPDRRPGSLRRTATIDMLHPGGFGTPLKLIGRSRDLLTPTSPGAEPQVLGHAAMVVGIAPFRTISSIEVTPPHPGIEGLVGAVGGEDLRTAIDRVAPNERSGATPLHVLLDDIAGTSLIAGFVRVRFDPDARRMMGRPDGPGRPREFGVRKGRIICSGLRPNGWADLHRIEMEDPGHAVRPAGTIRTSDPWGWHEFPPDPQAGMRRHRRIDIWRDGDVLYADAFFRDSCWDPDGTEMALHEYTVTATVDRVSGALRSAEATPHVLPFPECQWAAPHAQSLIGTDVATFRTSVQQQLSELRACTHLNDMLRCLAEVPRLGATL